MSHNFTLRVWWIDSSEELQGPAFGGLGTAGLVVSQRLNKGAPAVGAGVHVL